MRALRADGTIQNVSIGMNAHRAPRASLEAAGIS
jgi:hypothetical protein